MDASTESPASSASPATSDSPTSQNFPQLPASDEIPNATPPSAPDPDSNPALSERQLRAVELLLTGASDTDVAAAVGVSRRTIYTWRTRHAPFRAYLQRRRQDVFDAASDRLRGLLSSALDAFDRQIRDRYVPTSHRAAKALLALARLGPYASTFPASPDGSGVPVNPSPASPASDKPSPDATSRAPTPAGSSRGGV